MKRARRLPRRAAELAILRGRVVRAARVLAECLGIPAAEVLTQAGLSRRS